MKYFLILPIVPFLVYAATNTGQHESHKNQIKTVLQKSVFNGNRPPESLGEGGNYHL